MSRFVGLGLVLALGLGVLVAVPADAQKGPADFTLEGAKDAGKVTFSHEKHKAAGAEKCTACHTKLFKMKKGTSGPLTMEKMKAGEQCGACHDGKTKMMDKVVFGVADQAGCGKCHQK